MHTNLHVSALKHLKIDFNFVVYLECASESRKNLVQVLVYYFVADLKKPWKSKENLGVSNSTLASSVKVLASSTTRYGLAPSADGLTGDSNTPAKKNSVKLMAPWKKSSHMEYTYAIWKSYHFWFESYGKGLRFCSCITRQCGGRHRAMILAPETYLSRLAKMSSWQKNNAGNTNHHLLSCHQDYQQTLAQTFPSYCTCIHDLYHILIWLDFSPIKSTDTNWALFIDNAQFPIQPVFLRSAVPRIGSVVCFLGPLGEEGSLLE